MVLSVRRTAGLEVFSMEGEASDLRNVDSRAGNPLYYYTYVICNIHMYIYICVFICICIYIYMCIYVVHIDI